jgi:hypothetical protein
MNGLQQRHYSRISIVQILKVPLRLSVPSGRKSLDHKAGSRSLGWRLHVSPDRGLVDQFLWSWRRVLIA